MAMTRAQLRLHAAKQRYQAERNKPPTRKQVQAWLAPIRKALSEIRTGECDAYRGYAITRIHHADNDFARVDHAINGFVALMDRLLKDIDTSCLKKVSAKLEAGILLELQDVEACAELLKEAERHLLTFKRCELIDAANTEMINIELERLGMKEAA